MRLARLVRYGIKTARVAVIDDEYVRVDIEQVSGSGHAYLYFPTLTWGVWENHPFSSAVLPPSDHTGTLKHDIDLEKLGNSTDGSDNDSPER